MNRLTMSIRNLLGQPIRSALTIMGVAVAIGGFVAMTGLTRGLEVSIERGMEEPGADLIVTQRGAYGLISGSIPESLGPALARIEHVSGVSGALLNVTTADNAANIVICGWPSSSFLWDSLRLVAGRAPRGGAPYEAVLGESIANALNWRVGDQVELQFQTYDVVGVAAFSSVFNENIALVPLSGLQQLLGRPGTVTLFEVRLSRPLSVETAAAARAQLARAAADFPVSDTAEFADNLRFNRQIKAIASALGLVVMVMAALAIANTLLRAVTERTQELGILAAVGWTPRRIVTMILIEGTIISAFGGAIGLVAGVAAMHVVSRLHIAAGLLEPYFNLALASQAVAAALIIGLLGSLYPALRAIRRAPAMALRSR